MPVAPCVPNFSCRSILPSPSVSRRPRMNPGCGGCPCTLGPLRTETKMSPFGATTRLRAVPRLSAMTPAQKPVGSVSPPLSVVAGEALLLPVHRRSPGETADDRGGDGQTSHGNRQGRSRCAHGVLLESIVGEHACAAPALFNRAEEPGPARALYAANGFSSAVGPYTDGTD